MKILFRACKISAILLAIISLFSGCKNNKSDEKDKFVVGMECAYAPFNWIQPSSKNGAVKISGGWYACGYDVYMAKEIADKLGKELEIVKIDWDGLLPALTSGKIDAVIAGMSATEDRKKAIDFTDDYYTSDVVIVVKKDSPYAKFKSIEEFKGTKITGQLSTVQYDFIDQIPQVEKQTAMEDISSMVSAVNAGKSDGFVSEKPAAMIVANTNPTLTYVDFENGQGFNYSNSETAIAIGVKKGSKLRDKINSALSTISEEKKVELMKKAIGGAIS